MSSNVYSFRRLLADELGAGYACLMDTCAWLEQKGIRQWLRPLPRPVYEQRHARGDNYALLAGQEIVAIVSLLAGVPKYWQDFVTEPSVTWMATLAVRVHGQKLGQRTVRDAVQLLASQDRLPVYLDCRTGYLEAFYRDLGFVSLATRSFKPTPDFVFDATLMRL